ncbi:MAG: preprotein translocase subunit SecF, partial [Methanogenium sp.]|nr:preprotein translocase subunit SecF [Methanogenium sp.]
MVNFTYDISKDEPRQMVALPVAMLVIAMLFLAFNTISTGMPVEPGIDFAGGVAVTLFTDDSREEIETYFSDYPLKSVGESLNDGRYLVFDYMDDTQFRKLTGTVMEQYPDAKVDQIGETFGKSLQTQAVWALLFSFIGMAIVVFIAFKTVIPSVAVVISAFSDIIITAAFMNV